MRRSAVIPLSCAVFAAAGGWLYQHAGQRRDNHRFPPPGRLVDIGGRQLHVVQSGTGEGAPVVVLPALGTPGLEWHKVFDALPENITAYAVDRGGIGWSDPAPRRPRTPMVLAREITGLLDALELTSVVLVGHSYGGIVARVVAASQPGRVVGLVLVDSSHEDQMQSLAAAGPEISANELWWDAARRQAVPLGWYRAWHDLAGRRRRLVREAVGEVGARMAPAAAARALTTARRRAVVGELLGLALAPHVTPDWTRRLGDLPTTVLTVGDGNGWGPAYQVWLDLQRSLATMSSHTRHVVVNGTGHHMNHDVPNQVAAAIVNLTTEAREASRTTDDEPRGLRG